MPQTLNTYVLGPLPGMELLLYLENPKPSADRHRPKVQKSSKLCNCRKFRSVAAENCVTVVNSEFCPVLARRLPF